MKGLELLNTMALLDGEREFLDNDFSGDIDVSFESEEKAREAFEYTSSIRAALKVQAEESNIPAAWTEMINAHPETACDHGKQATISFASFLALFKSAKALGAAGLRLLAWYGVDKSLDISIRLLTLAEHWAQVPHIING